MVAPADVIVTTEGKGRHSGCKESEESDTEHGEREHGFKGQEGG